jgi:hypothetical protein
MSELSPLTNDRAADAHQDWPNLIGRAVDDVSLILHSEAEILQTRLGDSVRSGLNHSAEVVALLALSCGASDVSCWASSCSSTYGSRCGSRSAWSVCAP